MIEMQTIRDGFLSEEDLDLRNLSWDELIAYWNLWLEQAQASNEVDRKSYSHGVFVLEPPWPPLDTRMAGRQVGGVRRSRVSRSGLTAQQM